jgi:hypothetical protein
LDILSYSMHRTDRCGLCGKSRLTGSTGTTGPTELCGGGCRTSIDAQFFRATCDAIAAALAFFVIVRGRDRRLRRTMPKAPAEHRGGDRSD